MRVRGGFDLRHLLHQLFVERDAAGRIEDHDVVAAELGSRHGAVGDLQRRLPSDDRQRRNLRLLAEHAQLLLRRRTPRIERRHQDLLAVPVGESVTDLGRCRCLARALQADHQDRDRRHGVQVDRFGVRTQNANEFVVDDLHDHLAGRHRFDDIRAHGLRLHGFREVFDHIERHVRLEQRAAHLAHRLRDVAVGQRATAAKLVENTGQPVRKALEHRESQ